jgi:hypothetical protein
MSKRYVAALFEPVQRSTDAVSVDQLLGAAPVLFEQHCRTADASFFGQIQTRRRDSLRETSQRRGVGRDVTKPESIPAGGLAAQELANRPQRLAPVAGDHEVQIVGVAGADELQFPQSPLAATEHERGEPDHVASSAHDQKKQLVRGPQYAPPGIEPLVGLKNAVGLIGR